MEKEFDLIVNRQDAGKRLDVYLSCKTGISRSQIEKLIHGGRVSLNSLEARSSYKVKDNDRVLVSVPEPQPLEAQPEDIPLDIIYEDKDIIVINKAKGIVVHPSAGHTKGTLVNAILHHCKDLSGIGGKVRPGVVHRLDKDTTGLLIFAKNNEAHSNLNSQMRERKIKKTYIALVQGKVKQSHGLIDAPLGRHPVNRKKVAVIKGSEGKKKEAITGYKVLQRYSGDTLLELDLQTGRTHQIRVHLSHIGHPVVGDETYSKNKSGIRASGQLLHAAKLVLEHPITGKTMTFEAPMPKEFRDILEGLSKE